ncbi:tetratricopeptide repeat protein [Francisella sp. SYW-9]|uniref:tetratricopeptide repeat protein n=1 Tax=Francisella sp. SYW-9 TaxID=2610888 RepID=UPI00123C8A79|nr:SEL1-like repeat protein [Francisella sp. SYW-9]
MSEQDNSNKTTKERSTLLAPGKKSDKKNKLLISKDKSKASNKKKKLLIPEDENDNKISNKNDELLVFENQYGNEVFDGDNETLIVEDQNDHETPDENNETLTAEDQNDHETPDENNETLIVEDQTDDEISSEDNEPPSKKSELLSALEGQNNNEDSKKEAVPLVSKKKKIIRILIGIAIVGVCIVGVNKYIDYRHEVFLQEYAKAITNIKNKNVKGYEAAFEILQDLADDDEATSSDYYYLGYLYQYGLGTQKNYSNAYKYYKKANSAQAFYQMAILYKYGQGVNKNNKKAIEYYKKSYKSGNKKAIIGLAKFLESNPKFISTSDPELLYQIYLTYQSNKIKENKPGEKNKYLSIAVSKSYEPAIIKQAELFTKNKDYHRASILWQKLLYSSNTKTADRAEKEMAKIEALIKEQREKELEEKTSKKEIVAKKAQPKSKDKKEIQELIKTNREIGLTIPKQKLKNLNGLVYINLFNTDKEKLQKFYKSLSGIEIENGWIINSKNSDSSYINNLINLSKFKHNKSSLRFDFGNNNSTNKYEGLVYYFYNNKNELIQNTINNIIQNKPKESSLTPNLNNNNLSINKSLNKSVNKSETPQEQENILDQLQEKLAANPQKQTEQQDQSKQDKNQIQLTYKEKIQRMQVFAQKGDYKELYKLEHAASDGDVYAIYYTGVYYYNLKDYEKAMDYFEEASSKNYGPADYMLANMYYDEKENGIPYNKEKAKMYYKKAANLGVKNAEHILMLMD